MIIKTYKAPSEISDSIKEQLKALPFAHLKDANSARLQSFLASRMALMLAVQEYGQN